MRTFFAESGIWVWKYSDNEAAPDLFGGDSNEDNVANEENWVPVTTLRGHLQDVIGLSWSPCSQFIVSCATDSTAIVFDVKKGAKVKMLDDHKGKMLEKPRNICEKINARNHSYARFMI